jgi:hypothetical protein
LERDEAAAAAVAVTGVVLTPEPDVVIEKG